MNRRLHLCIILVFTATLAQAQCINTFPYNENFESSDGNWVPSGSGSDWAWGQPSKPIIGQAASGNNCWITGGLPTSFYNLGERSWLQSPCFNFSALQYPYISFNIFWESEKNYDGTNLQYSLDGGSSWTNVGGTSGPFNCLNENWYNTSGINNLSGLATVAQGWTGNTLPTSGTCVGGGGSSGWVLARQCITNLAGEPSVIFRFTFGAGTACNNYDGIAIDDIFIGDAPKNVPDFNFSCSGFAVSFLAVNSLCPDNVDWNFGDGFTANGVSPNHTYTSPGAYNVTVTAGSACNGSSTITKTVEILDIEAGAIPVTCSGATNGKAYVTVNSTNGPFTYQWSVVPPQNTDTVRNLSEGPYVVTVSSPNACPTVASMVVNVGPGMSLDFTTSADTCNRANGMAIVQVSDGEAPFTYNWSTGNGGAVLSSVAAGIYRLTVVDAGNCVVADSVVIGATSGVVIEFDEIKKVSCQNTADGAVTAHVAGGIAPYTFAWNNQQADSIIKNLGVGEYKLTVTDADGCFTIDEVIIEKEVCRSYVYFPTAFSPNGDGVNETFRPKYSPDLEKYALRVYNRWGELVYESTDVQEGWDGFYKGIQQPLGTYVYTSEYVFADEQKHVVAGNFTLVY